MPLAQYYTAEEVAAKLRVDRRTVYEWIRQGRLKAYKVGSALRIEESAVKSFVVPYEPSPDRKDTSPAQAVREYAFKQYVEPAISNGAGEVAISVGEIHRALGFRHRFPVVCNALEHRFTSQYCLRFLRADGPLSGSRRVYYFEILSKPGQ